MNQSIHDFNASVSPQQVAEYLCRAFNTEYREATNSKEWEIGGQGGLYVHKETGKIAKPADSKGAGGVGIVSAAIYAKTGAWSATGATFRECLKDAAEFVGVDVDTLLDAPAKPKKATRPQIDFSRPSKIYSYTDEQGNELYQNVRFEFDKAGNRLTEKTFVQRKQDAKGKWIYKDARIGVRSVPYRLPSLVNASEIHFCEGEKDADTLAAMGFDGATNLYLMGSDEWQQFAPLFTGKPAFVYEDNDAEGRKKSKKLSEWLLSIGASSVKIIRFEDMPNKSDVTDWKNADASHDSTALRAKLDAAECVVNGKENALTVSGTPPNTETTTQQYRALRSEAIMLLKSNKIQEAVSSLVREWKIVETMLTRPQLAAFIRQYARNSTPQEVDDMIDSAFDSPHQNIQFVAPLAENLTDTGNAMRLTRLHGERLRYVAEWGKWITWNGQAWELDKGQCVGVMQLTGDVIKSLYGEAAKCDDPEQRKQIATWAKKSESRDTRTNMISLAISQPGIAVSHELFDADGMKLNVKNGIIDLTTGALTKHTPAALMTHFIPIDYDVNATCPTWLEFLRVVLNDDADMIAFLQRAMGYTLTGDVSEQCLFFLHGSGKNGKSTFINLLSFVLGSYRKNLKINSLLTRNNDSIPNDIARLVGARCVTVTETEEGRRLNESLIKDLTGGDTISARFMRGEWFDFTPVFKMWMFGNHKPDIRGTDDGIWRRVRLIPFTVQIPAEVRDQKLGEKLKREAAGVLAWMVRGCLAWQKDGLQEPGAVTNATQKYRQDMDTLADFFEEYTIQSSSAHCTKQNLHAAYVIWAEKTSQIPVKNKTFNTQVRERFPNLVEDRGNGNAPTWFGIGLLASEDRK